MSLLRIVFLDFDRSVVCLICIIQFGCCSRVVLLLKRFVVRGSFNLIWRFM